MTRPQRLQPTEVPGLAARRRIARERAAFAATEPNLDTPDWLMARWSKTYGAKTAHAIAEAHSHEPPLDLTVKGDAESWAARLRGVVLPTGSVRLIAHG